MTWKREGQEVDREAVLASLADEDVNLQEVKLLFGGCMRDRCRRGCFSFRCYWQHAEAHPGEGREGCCRVLPWAPTLTSKRQFQ